MKVAATTHRLVRTEREPTEWGFWHFYRYGVGRISRRI